MTLREKLLIDANLVAKWVGEGHGVSDKALASIVYYGWADSDRRPDDVAIEKLGSKKVLNIMIENYGCMIENYGGSPNAN
jgi:hypothetical protein